jgi:hypothetical protein
MMPKYVKVFQNWLKGYTHHCEKLLLRQKNQGKGDKNGKMFISLQGCY